MLRVLRPRRWSRRIGWKTWISTCGYSCFHWNGRMKVDAFHPYQALWVWQNPAWSLAYEIPRSLAEQSERLEAAAKGIRKATGIAGKSGHCALFRPQGVREALAPS